MLKSHDFSHGFTLVEMAVALAILGLLLLAAIPSYTTYIANNNLRNTAELFYSAAQKARAEAIRRNETVELVLTNDTPPVSTSANVATLVTNLIQTTNGTNWVIRAPNSTGANRFIDSKVAAEAGGSSITVDGGGTTRIQFNGVGEAQFWADTTLSATDPILVQFKHTSENTACLLTGGVRCLTVRISGGGQARLCEPNQPATDNRSC